MSTADWAAIEPAIVDAAAARGVEVVRSHRCDIHALRQAAVELLSELGQEAPTRVRRRRWAETFGSVLHASL